MTDLTTLDVKPILASRTVWSSLVGLACLVASIFGVETQLIDQGALAEALLQAATGVSFAGTIVFRVLARCKLTA
ncbi:MAG: hypothetical protein Q8O26_00840 [Phreatobacter sp.]|uniref:hypothetical protein n=1 Tax=Phreatobacter sp. TaxID=1966341 RepID=UPI002734BA3C|nr:hypothetical protein [Phreatobacter sp.]MDP2800408.1 hypothetical protein [Phreatobacter sp.]